MADLVAAGARPTSQFSWKVTTSFPEFRDHTQVTLFLDEIQLVPGWETFARRILDSEKVRRFVSGSSATMLSQRAENESQFKRWFPFFQTDVDLT